MKSIEEQRIYRKLYMRKWMASHREIIRKRESDNYYRDREKVNARRKEKYAKDIEKSRAYGRAAYQRTKAAYSFRARQRKIDLLMAIPQWVDRKQLYTIYSECRRRSLIEGVEYHVDHIFPLRHKLLCGLHVPWNLQIITQQQNLSKGNRLP